MKPYEIYVEIGNLKTYGFNRVAAKQEDKGRKIRATILDQGVPLDLNGRSVYFYANKPDKKEIYNNCIIIDRLGGIVEFELTTQTLAENGIAECELVVTKLNGEKISSALFNIEVIKSINSDTAVESQSEFTLLTQSLANLARWEDMLEVKYDGLEVEYATELTTVKSQLADTATEIITARDGEANLKARLDKENQEVTTQLAETALKSELKQVELKKSNRNEVRYSGVPIGLNDLSPEALLAIEGGEGTNFNLETIPRDLSVSEKKTTFIDTSTNIFNPNSITKMASIDVDTGDLSRRKQYNTTDFIRVESSVYSFFGFQAAAFYDESYSFITRTNVSEAGGTLQVPSYANAVFMRAHFNINNVNEDEIQINSGDILLPYEPYYKELKYDVEISRESVDFLKKSTNLFNPNVAHKGKSIDASTGELSDFSQYYTTDYIPIKDNHYTFFGFQAVAFYDEDKNFIAPRQSVVSSETNPVTVEIYDGAYFMRAHFNINNVNEIEVQINAGETLLPYEPFYNWKLDEDILINNLPVEEDEGEIEIKEFDKYIIGGQVDGYYNSPEIQNNVPYGNLTASDIYSDFDGLVTNYPNYVSRTLLGKDSSDTENVYRYDFKPETMPSSVKSKTIKMILLAGVHGQEKMPPPLLYNTMKQICDNWQDNTLLETLRWNVHFIVIPVVNPWGWSRTTKNNSNNVNIARNFPTDWSVDERDPGSHPLSEVEAQYVDGILKENKDDVVWFTSFHNFLASTDSVPELKMFVWQAAATQLQMHVGKKLVSRTSRNWFKEYEWLQSHEDTYYGYSNMASPRGSEGRQATSYGIHGSSFETARNFIWDSENKDAQLVAGATLPVTLGVEAYINFILLGLKHGVSYKNSRQ